MKRKRFLFSLQPPIYSSFPFSFQLSLQTRAWKRFLGRPEQTHLEKKKKILLIFNSKEKPSKVSVLARVRSYPAIFQWYAQLSKFAPYQSVVNILDVGLCSEGNGDHGPSCDCVWWNQAKILHFVWKNYLQTQKNTEYRQFTFLFLLFSRPM